MRWSTLGIIAFSAVMTSACVSVLQNHGEDDALWQSAATKSAPLRYDQPREAMEFYVAMRARAGENFLPYQPYERALLERSRMSVYDPQTRSPVPPGEPLGPTAWQQLGPGNIGGRVRVLLFDPASPSTMYTAGVAGGVWKSTDSGASWTPLDDMMANLAVNSLAMDPGDSDVLYAGTGEGYFNFDAVRGAGIFTTVDAGANWTRLAATDNSDFNYVNDIVVSPNDSTVIYAATRTGLWRSTDSGGSWSQEIDAAAVSGCFDIAVRDDLVTDNVVVTCGTFSPSTAETGIWRSADGAAANPTWSQRLGPPGSGAAETRANLGRSSLAIAPSDQSTIYALVSCSASGADACGTGNVFDNGVLTVLRSTDSGATWSTRFTNNFITDETNGSFQYGNVLLTNPNALLCSNFPLSQGWYDQDITVDPTNANRLMAGGIDIFRSDDGGATWGILSYWFLDGFSQYAHADQHRFVFHPDYDGTTEQRFYAGNDGGLYVSSNAATATVINTPQSVCPANIGALRGADWNNLNNGFSITQFYDGSPYPVGTTYFGGTQDNGTLRGTDGGGIDAWSEIFGGDGGYVAVDPDDTQVLYAETTGISIRKSTDGGANFAGATSGISDTGLFINPFIMDPTNADRLWTTGSFIWRTDDAAASWIRASTSMTSRGSAIAVAPSFPERVLVGNTSGRIYRNDQASLATPDTDWDNTQPRSGVVSSLTFDPNDADIAYATYSTFGGGAHVWQSMDGGATWQGIDGTGGGQLPDIPVHSIVVDPGDGDTLWIGTDLGVYRSIDGGDNWLVENTGFANVVTETLKWQDGLTPNLFAFTHGRSAYRLDQNDNDFFISAGPPLVDACAPDDAQFTVDVDASVANSVTLAATVPSGLAAQFADDPLVAPDTTQMTISGTGNVAAGIYPIEITGTGVGTGNRHTVSVRISDSAPAAPTNLSPTDGAVVLTLLPEFTWTSVSGAFQYTLEIDDDPGFGSIDVTIVTSNTSASLSSPLMLGQTYYWRVRAANGCDGVSSTPTSFSTPLYCSTPATNIVSGMTVTDSLNVGDSGEIQDLDVALWARHTWVGDLQVTLEHPDSTAVQLLNQPQLATHPSGFGCPNDDLEVIFDDAAADAADDQCGSPAVAGTLSPTGSLADFNTREFAGNWTLSITDVASPDDGILDLWCLLPTLASTNTPPVANPDSGFMVDEGMSVMITGAEVKANDTDAEDGSPPLGDVVLVGNETNGTASLNGQTFTFTHDGTETATGTLEYAVMDSAGATSDPTTVTITVNNTNDDPVANNDTGFNVDEGMSVMIDVATSITNNDTDEEDGTPPGGAFTIIGATNGMAMEAGGTLTYTHDGTETAQGVVTYTIDDSDGATSNQATITIQVNNSNDDPVANPDMGFNVDEGMAVMITAATLKSNDSDEEDGIPGGAIALAGGDTNGTAALDGQTVTFTHDGSETDTASFQYTVMDSAGATSDPATVVIAVNNTNDPPVAVADGPGGAFMVNEGESVMLTAVQLKANDTDEEDLGGIPGGDVGLAGGDTNGTASLALQVVTFTHDGSETLTASFDYQVADSNGAPSNSATVSLTVNPVNDPPTTVDDGATVQVNGSEFIDVLANDSDVDDTIDVTTVQIASMPSSGSAVPQADGRVLYTPATDFLGMDSFTYTVEDNAGDTSDEATVNVTVADLSFATCGPGGNRAVEEIPVSIDVSVRFTGPIVGYSAQGLPTGLSIDNNGVISGIPDAGTAAGSPYAVTVTADDGGAGQTTTFLLTVDGASDTFFFGDFEDGCILPAGP